jgi:hypothetical protein
MRNLYLRLKAYFEKIVNITLGYKHFEKFVWKELIKLHKIANWHHGLFMTDKYIETVFEIAENKTTRFFYMLYEGSFHCRVKIIEDFPIEVTTDLFILATHFNNLLNQGIVIVNVENRYVEYHVKSDLIVHVIYPGEIHSQIVRHHKISKDVFWAFNKLLVENEEPALIIADLFKMKDESK